mmetsp:Transcript_5722/g.7315  ORF Transcript_5722/g.7315 Transcript_5722/m.7315 type:complete len:273 (+) Transcript_5722:175-993(+)
MMKHDTIYNAAEPSAPHPLPPPPLPKLPTASQKISKQDQILSSIIFPRHVPEPFHPNVNSIVSLIQDLEDINNRNTKRGTSTSTSSTSNQDQTNETEKNEIKKERNLINETTAAANQSNTLFQGDNEDLRRQHLEKHSNSFKEIYRISKHCEHFLHKSNIYRLQLEQIKAKENEASMTNTSMTETNYTKRKQQELNVLYRIHMLNYKYCIASQACPERMKVLNTCFGRYSPNILHELARTGRHDVVCDKEKVAVERGTGKFVMDLTRDILEE